MAGSLLSQLRDMTVVVADTGDLASIERFRPRDATTNPSLVLAAARMPAYGGVVDEVVARSAERLHGEGDAAIVSEATEALGVAFGARILGLIDGRVSTEVDARQSFDTRATVETARRIIARYAELGLARERILIKIAATWEGIQAARELEQDGIHCNLTLLFGLHQAIACAEADVTLISPFVGRILDWHRARTGRESYPPHEDPGVVSVTTIYNYYKRFGYDTEVMGASFRNVGEIIELAGCDLLTIAPNLLEELDALDGTLMRKLSPDTARYVDIERIDVDRARFDAMHAADPMATDKLAEGIAKFSEAIVDLEAMVAGRLAALRA
jgi:transaldolase